MYLWLCVGDVFVGLCLVMSTSVCVLMCSDVCVCGYGVCAGMCVLMCT